VIDRPIEEVFASLADGENDRKFSPRVLEIAKTTDGPAGVGTVYASTVKDAGREDQAGVQAHRVRAAHSGSLGGAVQEPRHRSRGGYDLVREDSGTRVTIYNVLEGHGPGKLIAPLALRSARRGRTTLGGRSRRPSRRPEPARGARNFTGRCPART
jgi:hypothetical protein